MGGHHHVEDLKIPDWRIYRVEDVPELVTVRKALAAQNLRDPWLRNYVWYYTEGLNNKKVNPPFRVSIMKGFKFGAVAALISAALETAYFKFLHPHHDDHGSHH